MTKKPMTPKFSGNKGLILFVWPLSTAGFAILLAGVASMQKQCGAEPLNNIASGTGGVVGYLAPVSCDHFFQYTWWIASLHFFVWGLAYTIAMLLNILHKTRVALVGMLAVTAVLLMDTANTYLYFNYTPGLSSTMVNRARITVAGAIIAAVADLLLILIIGYNDETTTAKERGEYGHNTYVGTTGVTPNPPISGHV